MSNIEFSLIMLSAVLSVAVFVLIALIFRNKRRVKLLTKNIEKYLEKGELTKFSTNDDGFAPLQNAVCHLENALELQKHTTE